MSSRFSSCATTVRRTSPSARAARPTPASAPTPTRPRGSSTTTSGTSWSPGRLRAGANQDEFALARFTPNGKLDPAFAGGGITRADIGPLGDTAQDVAIDPVSKRIVVGGYDGPQAAADWALARYEGVPRCAGKVPTIAGTPGSETIRGTTGKDVISTGVGERPRFRAWPARTRSAPGSAPTSSRAARGTTASSARAARIGCSAAPARICSGADRARTGWSGPRRDRLRGGPGRDHVRQ